MLPQITALLKRLHKINTCQRHTLLKKKHTHTHTYIIRLIENTVEKTLKKPKYVARFLSVRNQFSWFRLRVSRPFQSHRDSKLLKFFIINRNQLPIGNYTSTSMRTSAVICTIFFAAFRFFPLAFFQVNGCTAEYLSYKYLSKRIVLSYMLSNPWKSPNSFLQKREFVFQCKPTHVRSFESFSSRMYCFALL